MNFYNEVNQKLFQSLVIVFPIIYIVMTVSLAISGNYTPTATTLNTVILISKIIIITSLLCCFIISLINKNFRDNYISYPVYFLIFMLNVMNAMRIFSVDEYKPIHVLIAGCVLILNTYIFNCFKWLITYSIFSLTIIFIIFKYKFNNTR